MSESVGQKSESVGVGGESVHGLSLEGTLGARLRAKRKQRDLNIEDVAHHLKLDSTLLKAFEEDSGPPHGLPEVYYKGFLRNYARYLKVEINGAVNRTARSESVQGHARSDQPFESRRVLWPYFLLLIVAAAYWWLKGGGVELYQSSVEQPVKTDSGQQLSQPEKAEMKAEVKPETGSVDTSDERLAESPAVVNEVKTEIEKVVQEVDQTSVEPTGVEPQSGEHSEPFIKPGIAAETGNVETVALRGTVTIRYIDRSWTQVTDGLGRVLVKRTLDAGAIEDFEGLLPLEINLGNAIGVRVQFNGKPFDHLNYIDDNNIAQFTLGGQE